MCTVKQQCLMMLGDDLFCLRRWWLMFLICHHLVFKFSLLVAALLPLVMESLLQQNSLSLQLMLTEILLVNLHSFILNMRMWCIKFYFEGKRCSFDFLQATLKCCMTRIIFTHLFTLFCSWKLYWVRTNDNHK